MVYLFSLLVALCGAETVQSQDLYKLFVEELKSPEGVKVEVHGADHKNGLYAISYRPKYFFDFIIISLQPDHASPKFAEIKAKFETFRRHDFIQIKGNENDFVLSYQNHVMVKDLNIISKFSSSYDKLVDEYTHSTKVADLVQGKTTLIVKVHASLVDGKVLMVEAGDANIPVVVKNNALTRDLYRGDKVELNFAVQQYPGSPVHLVLNNSLDAVKMLDSVAKVHGQPQDRCGELVMFPQSPQVLFNVFALKSDIGDGLFRTFTLMNKDKIIFDELREKMQKVWDANTSTMVAGRNYFINPSIKVCAKGTGNMEVPTQANPQILIEKAADLTLEVLTF